MKEVEDSLIIKIKEVVKIFLEKSKEKEIQIISHFDTDGITSAAIMIKTLKKLDKRFSVKIVKNLEAQLIYDLPENKITLFLDLASGSLDHIEKSKLKDVFIIDHHEITQDIPEKVEIINPHLHNKQKISGSGLTYLFCKEINPENKKFAKLAILGMIGDMFEKEISKLNNNILKEGEVKTKRGLLIYPATRPLNRVLEYCSNPYIPEVTGNIKGVMELLRESGLKPTNKGYPSLIELSDDEMQKLVTAISLRMPKTESKEILGDIFLIKLFNKLEDAREISARINACSRLGDSGTALQFCMEIHKSKKKAESIHVKYRQHILSGLKFASETEKIQGKGYVILNAKTEIKDTIIGVIASILSNSNTYESGTTITTMAHYGNKIKISIRNAGGTGRNVREILTQAINPIGGEVGGHSFAAGGIIHQTKEQEFIDNLKKQLELEVVKI